MAWVYVIENTAAGLHKIGLTEGTVEKRLAQLQMHADVPLAIAHTITTVRPYQLERELHGRFAPRRQHGEWFRLTPDDLAAIRTEHPGGLTWARLVALEPQLEIVLALAKARQRVGTEYCVMDAWFGDAPGDEFKEMVCRLVGWERADERGIDPILASEDAYDVAYDTIFEALKPCRHPGREC